VLRQITRSGNLLVFLSPLLADDRADRLDKSYPLILGSFSWMPHTSKYFKLLTFSASRSCVRITRVVETERHLFLGKRIITLSPAAHIKLSTAEHVKSHRFSFLPSNLLLSHLLLTAPLPLPSQWLVKLTRSFRFPMSPSSMRPRVLLEQRAMFRWRLPPPTWPL
jgi:hypothetical protein